MEGNGDLVPDQSREYAIRVASKVIQKPVHITPVVHGEVNTVYFAQFEGKPDAVIRLSSRAHNGFEKEAWAYDKARQAGVDTPHVLHVSGNAVDGFASMITERLTGESGNVVMKEISDEKKREVYTQLGAEMRKLHTVQLSGFGPLQRNGDKYEGAYKTQWDSIEGDLTTSWWAQHAVETGALSQESLADLQSVFRKHKNLFTLPQATLIHADLSRSMKNAVVDPETHKISGIIDFENVIAGDPVQDVANFMFWGEYNQEDFDAFFKGYGNELRQNNDFQTKLLLFQLKKAHEMSVYYKQRGDDTSHTAMQKKAEQYRLQLNTLSDAEPPKPPPPAAFVP